MIRPYEDRDYDACRALWVELTERHRLIFDDPTIGGDDPGTAFDSYLALGTRAANWVYDDGSVVGFTGLLLDGGGGQVEPVVVTESRRSQGIGRELIETVIAEARARGLGMIEIHPVVANAEAMSLFHEIGFRTIGHIDLFIKLDDGDYPNRPTIDVHGRTYAT